MIIDLSNLTASDYAAWWGASIATLALFWNIIVAIRSGPRVIVSVTPKMNTSPPDPITKGRNYIVVTSVNRGTSSTTITHLGGYYSSDLWSLIRGKKQSFSIKIGPELCKQLPFVLHPGEEWVGLAVQEGITEKSEGGYLYLGVYHNQKNRPVLKRVKFNT